MTDTVIRGEKKSRFFCTAYYHIRVTNVYHVYPSTLEGLDPAIVEYARIHARGAIKDMVPRAKNLRPLLYWAMHPPENCALRLLERTPALQKLFEATPGCPSMRDMAVMLAEPVQITARQEK